MSGREKLYQRLKNAERDLYHMKKDNYNRAHLIEQIEYLKQKLGYKSEGGENASVNIK